MVYEPTSRRPIASILRKTADYAVRVCIRLDVHPDVISYLSIVAAAGAGVMFWGAGQRPYFLIFAPLLCYLRLWFNMLDGMVALGSGKASPRGEIINELPDRFSDVIIFVGIAHSGLMNIWLGYWTAIACLMVAYVGTLGQAIAGEREFGGLMSKPWRMATLHVGAWLCLALILWNEDKTGLAGLSALDWTMVVIIIGCVQTMFFRLKRTLGILYNRPVPERPGEER